MWTGMIRDGIQKASAAAAIALTISVRRSGCCQAIVRTSTIAIPPVYLAAAARPQSAPAAANPRRLTAPRPARIAAATSAVCTASVVAKWACLVASGAAAIASPASTPEPVP